RPSKAPSIASGMRTRPRVRTAPDSTAPDSTAVESGVFAPQEIAPSRYFMSCMGNRGGVAGMNYSQAGARDFLKRLFQAAVDAARPDRALAPFLPERPRGRTIVIGCGKGAAQMARAFEDLW